MKEDQCLVRQFGNYSDATQMIPGLRGIDLRAFSISFSLGRRGPSLLKSCGSLFQTHGRDTHRSKRQIPENWMELSDGILGGSAHVGTNPQYRQATARALSFRAA